MADPQGSTATSVRVRVRPLNARELALSGSGPPPRCLKPPLAAGTQPQQQLSFRNADGGDNTFTFDAVYGETSSQAEVFRDVAPVVDAVWDKGINGTILAYGQTGSGKTHTLIGSVEDEEHAGLVIRAIRRLAQGIAASTRDGVEFKMSLTVVEIYCERIRDLLDPSQDNLQVKQDANGIFIDGATEIVVTDEHHLVVLMQQGLAKRSVSATAMNAESSRSHCIVTVSVEKACSADGTVQVGKLTMVDLAGSERQGKTGAAGVTLSEGSQINKSLSCLANVIYALTDEKARHVPYRDSKLTRVLQDSLGGTARTVLIVCCSPSLDNAAETLSTLRFGSRAKGVSNNVQVNQRLSADKLLTQLEAVTARSKELEQEVARLRSALAVAQASAAATSAADSKPGEEQQQPASGALASAASAAEKGVIARDGGTAALVASAGHAAQGAGKGAAAAPQPQAGAVAAAQLPQAPYGWRGEWPALAVDVVFVLLLLLGLHMYFAWEDSLARSPVPAGCTAG